MRIPKTVSFPEETYKAIQQYRKKLMESDIDYRFSQAVNDLVEKGLKYEAMPLESQH